MVIDRLHEEKMQFKVDAKRSTVLVSFRIKENGRFDGRLVHSIRYGGETAPDKVYLSKSDANTVVMKFIDRTERHEVPDRYIEEYRKNDMIGRVMWNEER